MMNMHIHIRDGINDIKHFQKFIDNGKKYDIDTLYFSNTEIGYQKIIKGI